MTEALDAVLAGEADAAIVDAISLALYARSAELARGGPAARLGSLRGRGGRRRARPLNAINEALAALETDGTLAALRARWLSLNKPGFCQKPGLSDNDDMIHFDIFTLFPGMFSGFLADSILKRAQASGVMSVGLHNIRDYAEGRHRVTDDTPYGGGGGMVMKPEPIFRAVETVLTRQPGWFFAPGPDAPEPPAAEGPVELPEDVPVILLSPQGRTFTQQVAEELARLPSHRPDLRPVRGGGRAGARRAGDRRDQHR